MLERFGLPAVRGRVGVGGGVLWALGLPDGVKYRIRKCGLIFI